MEDAGMSPPSLHSDLYRAMRNEMLLRGYSRKTIKSYLSWIRSYLVSLIDSKELAYSSVNQAFNAIRFLYVQIYKRDFVIESIPRPKKGKILPTPLTQEEVKRIINVTGNIKHKAVLMISYSGGLRLGEVINLSPSDIDGDRRLIFVRGGKGRKDRYTLISEAALKVLREYYRAYRPANWLFDIRLRLILFRMVVY
jgi:integrase/recombinase XerD